MSNITGFPQRHAVVVWLLREGDAWLVMARGYGWVHGDLAAAIDDAQWLAANLQLPIRFIKAAA
jgi:hypothetical protein